MIPAVVGVAQCDRQTASVSLLPFIFLRRSFPFKSALYMTFFPYASVSVHFCQVLFCWSGGRVFCRTMCMNPRLRLRPVPAEERQGYAGTAVAQQWFSNECRLGKFGAEQHQDAIRVC
jgi:hypothetical protein